MDGVPILVKDEIPVLGFPVTLGTSFLSDTVEKDIYPILKLKEQGALIVGKTNQHEMGIGTTGFNLLNGTPRVRVRERICCFMLLRNHSVF